MRWPRIKLARGIIRDLAWVIWLLTIYFLLRCVILWAFMGIRKCFSAQESCLSLLHSAVAWLLAQPLIFRRILTKIWAFRCSPSTIFLSCVCVCVVFSGCWAFITPNKLEVSTHVRVGRPTLRCSVSLFPEYAFPECSHRIQDSLPMVLSVFTKLLICWLPLFHPLP